MISFAVHVIDQAKKKNVQISIKSAKTEISFQRRPMLTYYVSKKWLAVKWSSKKKICGLSESDKSSIFLTWNCQYHLHSWWIIPQLQAQGSQEGIEKICVWFAFCSIKSVLVSEKKFLLKVWLIWKFIFEFFWAFTTTKVLLQIYSQIT